MGWTSQDLPRILHAANAVGFAARAILLRLCFIAVDHKKNPSNVSVLSGKT
jgi:hypothetical protein